MQENNHHYKKSNYQIYLLITVILLLLGVNAYLFVKTRQESYFGSSISYEKQELVLQIKQIEAEFGKANSLFLINHELKKAKEVVMKKTNDIKVFLHNKDLKSTDLLVVKNKLIDLKAFVKSCNERLAMIEKENAYLKNERNKLQVAINDAAIKSGALAHKNKTLRNKLKKGAALKATHILISPLRTKNNGKTRHTNYAKLANRLKISFSIVPNPLAAKGTHKVYLRVFDPYGNLIADDDNLFYVNEQKMQYSEVGICTYNEEEVELTFTMDWVNPKPFIKGNYTIILYTNNFVMGKTTVDLL